MLRQEAQRSQHQQPLPFVHHLAAAALASPAFATACYPLERLSSQVIMTLDMRNMQQLWQGQ